MSIRCWKIYNLSSSTSFKRYALLLYTMLSSGFFHEIVQHLPGADPDFKFDFDKALLWKLRLTNFFKIHKLPWKRKILVHRHVRIFLNFVTFSLIVLIKLLRIFSSKLIDNKSPLKKENSYAWLDYVFLEIFAGAHFS